MDGAQEHHRMIAQTVANLRSVQEDFADDAAEVREEHLREVVQRAIARLLPDQRRSFLQALRQRFPAWEAANGQPTTRAASQSAGVSDPVRLAQRLASLAAACDETQREAIISALGATGLVPAAPSAPPRANGSLGPIDFDGSALDPQAMADLLDRLLDRVKHLDETCRQLLRGAGRRVDLRRCCLDAITVDGTATLEQAQAELKRLWTTIASLLDVVRRAPDLAREIVQELKPGLIEARARNTKRGWFESAHSVRWRLYKEAYRELEYGLKEKVERWIEKRMEGFLPLHGSGEEVDS